MQDKIKQAMETYSRFAYDGCHKIYIIESDEQEQRAREYNYQILPIEELEDKFYNSCELRFINFWDLSKTALIQQGEL